MTLVLKKGQLYISKSTFLDIILFAEKQQSFLQDRCNQSCWMYTWVTSWSYSFLLIVISLNLYGYTIFCPNGLSIHAWGLVCLSLSWSMAWGSWNLKWQERLTDRSNDPGCLPSFGLCSREGKLKGLEKSTTHGIQSALNKYSLTSNWLYTVSIISFFKDKAGVIFLKGKKKLDK